METNPSRFGPVQIGIILLTLATAGIHISLTFPSVMFIMNGLGYLALLVAYFLPLPYVKDNRDLVRWIFIGFTALTILGWVAVGQRSMLAYITKGIEVILLILLWTERGE